MDTFNPVTADPVTAAAIAVTLMVVVALCSLTDIQSRQIPNVVLAPALALAFIIHGVDAGVGGILNAGFGLLIGLAMLMPFYLLGGTGAGDVKLLGVAGALLGHPGVFVAGGATLVAGGLLGIGWIFWRFLEAYLAAHLFHGSHVRHAGLVTHFTPQARFNVCAITIPYAPAIALGSLTAIWYYGLLAHPGG